MIRSLACRAAPRGGAARAGGRERLRLRQAALRAAPPSGHPETAQRPPERAGYALRDVRATCAQTHCNVRQSASSHTLARGTDICCTAAADPCCILVLAWSGTGMSRAICWPHCTTLLLCSTLAASQAVIVIAVPRTFPKRAMPGTAHTPVVAPVRRCEEDASSSDDMSENVAVRLANRPRRGRAYSCGAAVSCA